MINLLRIQKTVTSNQTSSVSFVLSHLVEIDEKSVGVRHYYYIVHIIVLYIIYIYPSHTPDLFNGSVSLRVWLQRSIEMMKTNS